MFNIIKQESLDDRLKYLISLYNSKLNDSINLNNIENFCLDLKSIYDEITYINEILYSVKPKINHIEIKLIWKK